METTKVAEVIDVPTTTKALQETGAMTTRAGSAIVSVRWKLEPMNMIEAIEMAKMIAGSGLCPEAYRGKWADVLIAGEMGFRLGLAWMQSLQNIAVINGRPSIWGDALPAIIMATGECERFHAPTPKAGDPAVCTIKRRGYPDEFVGSFSDDDALKAGLNEKKGPWQQYRQRMKRWRAVGFCAREAFPDKLMGLILAEEAMDLPPIDLTTQADGSFGLDVLKQLPQAQQDQITKAFVMLGLSPAQQRVLVNQYLVDETNQLPVDERVLRLVNHLMQEYKSKTNEMKGVSHAKPAATEPPPAPKRQVLDTSF